MSKNHDIIIKYILILAAVAVLGIGCYLAAIETMDSIFGFVVACGVLLCFAFLGHIQEFVIKKTGMSVKTRDIIKQAQEAASEAKATVTQLRELAAVLSKAQLSALNRIGRYGGGYSAQSKYEIESEILGHLEKLGFNKDEISAALEDAHKCIAFDYVQFWKIAVDAYSNIPTQHIKEFRGIASGGVEGRVHSPEELQEFMDKTSCLESQPKEILEDYSFFVEKGEHRRLDVWLAREELTMQMLEYKQNKATKQ